MKLKQIAKTYVVHRIGFISDQHFLAFDTKEEAMESASDLASKNNANYVVYESFAVFKPQPALQSPA